MEEEFCCSYPWQHSHLRADQVCKEDQSVAPSFIHTHTHTHRVHWQVIAAGVMWFVMVQDTVIICQSFTEICNIKGVCLIKEANWMQNFTFQKSLPSQLSVYQVNINRGMAMALWQHSSKETSQKGLFDNYDTNGAENLENTLLMTTQLIIQCVFKFTYIPARMTLTPPMRLQWHSYHASWTFQSPFPPTAPRGAPRPLFQAL